MRKLLHSIILIMILGNLASCAKSSDDEDKTVENTVTSQELKTEDGYCTDKFLDVRRELTDKMWNLNHSSETFYLKYLRSTARFCDLQVMPLYEQKILVGDICTDPNVLTGQPDINMYDIIIECNAVLERADEENVFQQ